ncbi:MAG: hypothetical protein ACI8Z5_000656 [Lentimonas sp.]|jgi:hypothetical protein
MEPARLKLHPEKTHTVDMLEVGAGFDFLGYRFYRIKRRIVPLVRPKILQKLRGSIRQKMRRCNAHSVANNHRKDQSQPSWLVWLL